MCDGHYVSTSSKPIHTHKFEGLTEREGESHKFKGLTEIESEAQTRMELKHNEETDCRYKRLSLKK